MDHQFEFHRFPWAEFDDLARSLGRPSSVSQLRKAERSRRLALLRAMVDQVAKRPGWVNSLPLVDDAWDLLAEVQQESPLVVELMLDHPYTGAWIGHTTRLVNDHATVDYLLWTQIGYLHSLVAAAAVRAGLAFKTRIPLWQGNGILPTLGMVHFGGEPPHSIAEVCCDGDVVEVSTATEQMSLPVDRSMDGPSWWGMRHVTVEHDGLALAVRLDDLDPYRSLHPLDPPQRMSSEEADSWRTLLHDAWQLIVSNQRELAEAIAVGLDSLVPRPAVAFGTMSASTAEAFGSAIIAKPDDSESLAVTLVHEFQHVRLSGLLQLVSLHHDDARQRFYTPWRADPRPVGGVLQGVYAFFGVTEFWRAMAGHGDPDASRRAAFEFAHWRAGTWRVLEQLRADAALTEAGQRFVAGIAERLGPWQDEPVPADVARLAETVAADHYAGWRIRHLRPNQETVDRIATAWLTDRGWSGNLQMIDDQALTPVPDGEWSGARAELIRLSATESRRDRLAELWSAVAGATEADRCYVAGRYTEAVRGYQAELVADPDKSTAWIGLGITLSALETEPAAAWVLLSRPELVRAASRRIQRLGAVLPEPRELADWIGRHLRSPVREAAGSQR